MYNTTLPAIAMNSFEIPPNHQQSSTETNTGTTTSTSTCMSLPRSVRWRIQLKLLDEASIGNEQLLMLLSSYRMRYDDLAKKHDHEWNMIASDITSDIISDSISDADDPLSMFAQMEEQKVKSRKEQEIEERKERAKASRPCTTGGDHYYTNSYTSSKDTMDIIHKDVDRLPVDHQVVAFFTKMKMKPNTTKQQQQQQQQQQFIFRLDESLAFMKQSLPMENDLMKKCRQERSTIIRQVLFVYAKEYPALGYRQGMHEVLSLIVLCLEIDLLNKNHQSTSATTSSTTTTTTTDDAIIDADVPSSGLNNDQLNALLDSTKIANDAYIIFEAVMHLLSPAFEVRQFHKHTPQTSSLASSSSSSPSSSSSSSS
mmetsp:Transcript_25964/g.30156  ORF Transcript_25964/g.30156 Transcript_25964/m.30156 type:complete len:370 (-) Transcript_25964:2-1111(-)